MNYLQGRRSKKNKLIFILPVIIVLPLLFYFRGGLSSATSTIFEPLLKLKNVVLNGSESEEIEKLRTELNEKEALMQNYKVLLDENTKLKDALGRKNQNANLLLAGILAKPNQSPYDTLLLDVGEIQGVTPGKRVFALGNIPIGQINEVTATTSKVLLFSSPTVRTEGVITGRDIFAELVGRGGGNFEMVLPREITLEPDTPIMLPGIPSNVVAIAETTISDPRDAFTQVLLRSPVNFFELKFVQVER